jgi:hypothetical protein
MFSATPWAEAVCGIITPAVMSIEERYESHKECATLYDVVGSVKRHVECASCGQLVFVLT